MLVTFKLLVCCFLICFDTLFCLNCCSWLFVVAWWICWAGWFLVVIIRFCVGFDEFGVMWVWVLGCGLMCCWLMAWLC